VVESGSEVKSVKRVAIPNRIKTYEEYRQALDALRQQYDEEVEGIERERVEKHEGIDKKYKGNLGLLMQKHPELGDLNSASAGEIEDLVPTCQELADLWQLMSEEYNVHEAQVAAKHENCFRRYDANQVAIEKAYETYGEETVRSLLYYLPKKQSLIHLLSFQDPPKNNSGFLFYLSYCCQ
jgi:hypothetical protein